MRNKFRHGYVFGKSLATGIIHRVRAIQYEDGHVVAANLPVCLLQEALTTEELYPAVTCLGCLGWE